MSVKKTIYCISENLSFFIVAIRLLESLHEALKKRGTFTLNNLTIRENFLGDKSCQIISQKIIQMPNNTTLEKLDLAENDLSKIGVDHIGDSLAKNCYLKYLDLSRNQGVAESASNLFLSLSQNEFLETLILCDCSLEDSFFGSFKEFFNKYR